MGNISINFSNLPNKKKVTRSIIKEKPKKIILTYHNCIQEIPEYYTYIDSDNNEQIFTDTSYMINKASLSRYIAKKTIVNKTYLEFVPKKDAIEYKPDYFTYNDNEVYLDKAIYNESTDSYNGVLKTSELYDEKIIIYEE